MTLLDTLIKAKLAGTKASNISPAPTWFGEYIFRSNEQAAAIALEALTEAGCHIFVPDGHGGYCGVCQTETDTWPCRAMGGG